MELLEEDVIPFRFRMDNLPIVIAILFCLVITFDYLFYWLEGCWTTYFPMLSETAVTSPNSAVFAVIFSLIAFLFFLVCSSVITWGEVYGVFHQQFIRFGPFGAAVCTVFLLIFAHFHVDDWLWADEAGSIPFTIFTLVFFAVLLQQGFTRLPMAVRVVRLAALGVTALMVIVFFVPEARGDGVTLRAACQLLWLSMAVVFVVTLRAEIAQLRVDLQILSD
jgi:hypothetical protein